jgi:hypothetical protein
MDFAEYVKIMYRTDPAQLRPTESPGYWEYKEPCGGRLKCNHPLHGCLGCDGPCRHTITFLDPARDDKGRFASPYRTWKLHRESQGEAG